MQPISTLTWLMCTLKLKDSGLNIVIYQNQYQLQVECDQGLTDKLQIQEEGMQLQTGRMVICISIFISKIKRAHGQILFYKFPLCHYITL